MASSNQYPEPTGGSITLGLTNTSHNGSNYPQPNSAKQPDPASQAPPSSAVPGPEVYRPSLAGNTMGSSGTPTHEVHGNEPPNLGYDAPGATGKNI